MFIGNVVVLVMNLPLAPLFAALLRVPYVLLAPAILVFPLVGADAAAMSFVTMVVAMGFGIIGYLMIKADLPRAPLVLALVLAPLLEESLRQSLLLSLGSPMIFVERPCAQIRPLRHASGDKSEKRKVRSKNRPKFGAGPIQTAQLNQHGSGEVGQVNLPVSIYQFKFSGLGMYCNEI